MSGNKSQIRKQNQGAINGTDRRKFIAELGSKG